MKVVPVAGLLAGLLVAADSRQERVKPPKTDQEAIQGTWKVVDATLSGKKLEGTDLGEYGVLHLDKVNIGVPHEKWTRG